MARSRSACEAWELLFDLLMAERSRLPEVAAGTATAAEVER